jgi:hypothetical protein
VARAVDVPRRAVETPPEPHSLAGTETAVVGPKAVLQAFDAELLAGEAARLVPGERTVGNAGSNAVPLLGLSRVDAGCGVVGPEGDADRDAEQGGESERADSHGDLLAFSKRSEA